MLRFALSSVIYIHAKSFKLYFYFANTDHLEKSTVVKLLMCLRKSFRVTLSQSLLLNTPFLKLWLNFSLLIGMCSFISKLSPYEKLYPKITTIFMGLVSLGRLMLTGFAKWSDLFDSTLRLFVQNFTALTLLEFDMSLTYDHKFVVLLFFVSRSFLTQWASQWSR